MLFVITLWHAKVVCVKQNSVCVCVQSTKGSAAEQNNIDWNFSKFFIQANWTMNETNTGKKSQDLSSKLVNILYQYVGTHTVHTKMNHRFYLLFFPPLILRFTVLISLPGAAWTASGFSTWSWPQQSVLVPVSNFRTLLLTLLWLIHMKPTRSLHSPLH